MNPLLLDIPGELRSDRLLLRVPRAGDGAIVYPSVRESLAELKPWMPWATDDYNEQGCEEWCRRAAAEFLSRKQAQFLIFPLGQARHVGTIGAHDFNWEIPSGEIGYWLRTADSGRGMMTEAVLLVLKMLREVLHVRRVQIRSDEQNFKSRAVAERAGFQLEGILRKDCVATGGRLRNTCVYSWIDAEEAV
jgi:ribosomal-protein-serine acetyltransferase